MKFVMFVVILLLSGIASTGQSTSNSTDVMQLMTQTAESAPDGIAQQVKNWFSYRVSVQTGIIIRLISESHY